MTPAESPAYREQLRAPMSWYFIGFLFGLSLALIFLWFGPYASLAGLVGGTLLSAWVVASYGRVGIELSGDSLTAGPATLPLAALGEARALSAEQARALQRHEADPRAFMLLRSYVRTAVRVEVVDPQDPHPYLYLSSRHPEKLAAAFARANAAAGS
ncbi:DUF3093 domain-containing protein [Actinospica sp. MGRD01-02]|uniref:DUF3093 domain-containing protein n=1 Tax=Actinospica acidithermotolerans TaxID=2828514 RepID=A0A941EBH9_9ACTN|nr:DUF3093 domain-containing protein [Actinospica acidithermotolerans]MBR7829745.1 DUF3093 domain-containing protein [Actinospica acidithermotolerans]